MEQITTSVALATYNGIQYIEEQLKSIVNQTKAVDQVIISDDKSTDGTYEFVCDFIKNNHLLNWNIISNEDKHGVTCNFINALSHCSGNVIFLCDQDDVWEEKKVERILDVFRKDETTTCVISCIQYLENGKIINRNTPFTRSDEHEVDLKELLSVCSYLGMSSAFTRNIINITDKDFMSKTSHDWAFYLTALQNGKIKYLGEVCQYYRIHGNNASVENTGSFRENRLRMLKKKLYHIIESKNVTQKDMVYIVDDYAAFMKKRIYKIENRNVLSILFLLSSYKKRKYSIRNYVADLKAAIEK